MVDLTEAFPIALRDTARSAVAALTPAISDKVYEPKKERQIVRVCGDDLWLPGRINDKGYRDHAYCDAGPFLAFESIAENSGLTSLQKQIFFCLLTRHHNGFVREAALKHIIAVAEPWVVPYVVQLASEYVYEILVLIGQNLDQLNASLYGSFLHDNPAYFAKVKQRIISYWNVYYRWHDYSGPDKLVHRLWGERYIGHDISDRFDGMEASTSSGKDTSL